MQRACDLKAVTCRGCLRTISQLSQRAIAATPNPVDRFRRLPKNTLIVAIEWATGRLPTYEAQERIKAKSVNQTIYTMGRALRQAYRDGVLKEQV